MLTFLESHLPAPAVELYPFSLLLTAKLRGYAFLALLTESVRYGLSGPQTSCSMQLQISLILIMIQEFGEQCDTSNLPMVHMQQKMFSDTCTFTKMS